jgi:Tfp pilus assembly protein PilP
MNPKWQWWNVWWPQWRSHWRVLHAWPLSAQAVLLTVLTLFMIAGLSWQVSGTAWSTWWQAQEREAQAQVSLESLQRQVKQHQARVAALKAMPHPSGADRPAWVALSVSGVQVQTANSSNQQQWAGSLPSLLVAWQSLAEWAPQARVSGFALKADVAASATQTLPSLSLTLLTREDAEQALSPGKSPAKFSALATQGLDAAPSKLRFNPFDAKWLAGGLPPVAHASSPLKLPDAELSQWQWLGALSSPEKSSALLSFAGELYALTPGQALGADGGEIMQVNPDHLVLREWHINHQGQWQAQFTRWPKQGTP